MHASSAAQEAVSPDSRANRDSPYNQSCVQMSVNHVFHDKSKHIEIQYHFIHDMLQKGPIELQYVPTDDENIDVHTKPLPRMKLEYFHERLEVEEKISLLKRER